MKWISIKHTKPRDSRRILVWANGGVVIGSFNPYFQKWMNAKGDEIPFQSGVTHWAEIEGPTS